MFSPYYLGIQTYLPRIREAGYEKSSGGTRAIYARSNIAATMVLRAFRGFLAPCTYFVEGTTELGVRWCCLIKWWITQSSLQVAPVCHHRSCSQRSASSTVRFANWMDVHTKHHPKQVKSCYHISTPLPIPSLQTHHSRRGNHNRIEKRSEVIPLADRHPERAEDGVRRLQMKIEVGNPVREGRLLGRELDADGWSEGSVFTRCQ